jgi:hypothetical protein
MMHAPFLKLTSRELRAGKMVDVSSVSICRCGRKFSTDEELIAHVLRPMALEHRPIEEPKPQASPTLPASMPTVIPAAQSGSV